MLRVEGAAEAVGGEDVHAPVSDERRRRRHRVKDALHAWPHPLRRRAATLSRRRMRSAREVEKVRPLGLVELKCSRERLEDALRDAGRAAPL